jgi:transcriptional regulator with XRE-family HTH domain
MSTHTVGNNIKNLRLAKNMTMQEVAQASGCNKSMICLLESGQRTGGLHLLTAIAKSLDVDLVTLIRP